MKRILVIDESVAVRETLALILGRDFVVAHRPPKERFTESDDQVDLLILGLAPGAGAESTSLVKIASEVPFAVLFLVDSISAVLVAPEDRIDYLAKPFNPFELREKVGRLLARRSAVSDSLERIAKPKSSSYSPFIEFPYLSRSVSLLARRFGLTDLPVLIYGEVGSGQDRVARAIHELSGQEEPLIRIHARGESDGQIAESLCDLASSADRDWTPTLFIGGLDYLSPIGQTRLLNFLEEQERRGRKIRVLSSARQDLLEKVYRGEFLDSLYYLVATLKLRLPPLRERTSELPALAQRVAQDCGRRLGVGQVHFSPDAIERLRNYLWFGNLGELETVLSRTLAIHRKATIEVDELIMDLGASEGILESDEAAGAELETEGRRDPGASAKRRQIAPSNNGNTPDLTLLINELAHELKNPMVTIKTFSQLLGERFDDAGFRNRFQETVSNDIDRMDDLLEALLDFSRLPSPQIQRVPIVEELRRAVEEILPDCDKRSVKLCLARSRETVVFADVTHLQYVVKNLLRSALSEVRSLGEIAMDAKENGEVVVSYANEGGQVVSLRQYLDGQVSSGEEVLPVRMLLAKILLQRNGGGLRVERREGGEVRVILQLPSALSGVQCP
jgi:two-component system nitrogen regulation response regulator GlnG